MRVYILLSLSQRYSLIIGEIQLINKYLSFSLVRCSLGGSFQKIWSQKLPKFTSDLSHSRPKALDSLSVNPPFFPRKASNLNQYSFVVYLIYNRRDQWQGEGSENEHETLGLRPRSSRERKWTRGSRGVGRETIGVRRTVVSQTLEVNSFFLINLFLLYWCVFCAALAVVFCRYFTYVFALGATAVALGAVIVNSSRK